MDRRTLMAVGLCLAIFLVWTLVVQPLIWPPPKVVPKPPQPAVKDPTPVKLPDLPAVVQPPPQQPTPDKRAAYPEKDPIALESEFLKVVFTNKGAGIRELKVKYPRPTDEVPILMPYETRWPHLALRHVGGTDPIESAPWEIVTQASDRVEFRYLLANGVELTKEFRLHKDKHTLGLTLSLQNRAKPPEGQKEAPEQGVKLEVLAFNGIHHDSLYRYDQYLAGVVRKDQKVSTTDYPLAGIEKGEGKLRDALKISDPKERDQEVAEVEKDYLKVDGPRKDWWGVKDRFFAALLVPDDAAQRVLDSYYFRLSSPDAMKAAGAKNIDTSARTDEMRIGAAPKVMQFTVFCGALEEDSLKEVPGAPEIVNFGGGCPPLGWIVRIIAPAILGVLHFCTSIFGNYGWGIILTTIIIRLCLFPLSLKSQRSAFQMQALGPKIQALRERYKDDQQKFGVEQMRLFKEHKINPLSGCLPLVLQMPIFIGMYSVFELSVDLRRAPFMLWIRDLSQPDALVKFGAMVDLPLIPVFDSLNILPILMTITWFLQAYLTPRSPDPNMAAQQKMMMAMPIVFGVMCYALASGLSLYFLVNSLLGMGEQKLIKKYFLKTPETVKPA